MNNLYQKEISVKTTTSYFLTTFFLLVFSSGVYAQIWTPVGNVAFSPANIGAIVTSIDQFGTQYTAYSDGATANKATVMKYNGFSWVAVGNVGFSAGIVSNVCMALNAGGIPYVCYTDDADSNKITVMKFNGTTWVTVGGQGFSAGEAENLALAIDASGTPYVAFRDYSNEQKSTVMKYDGSNWVLVGASGISSGYSVWNSLAFTTSGNPYIAFCDGGNDDKISVMGYDGSDWLPVGSVGFSDSEVAYVSIQIDSSNTPYVAYTDAYANNKVTVEKFNGVDWVFVGNQGFSPRAAYLTTMALDNGGTPYVAYGGLHDTDSYWNPATVMKYNDTGWAIVGNPDISAGAIGSLSLDIDNVGYPHIAYTDFWNDYKATAMRYGVDTITGPRHVCIGSGAALNNADSGGIWSVSNSTFATIDSITGLVAGLAAGADTIYYTLAGSVSDFIITVDPLSTTSPTMGNTTVGTYTYDTLSNSIAGGIWSATNSNALIGYAGVVQGLAPGSDTILYTVTSGACPSGTDSFVITVNSVAVPTPSGTWQLVGHAGLSQGEAAHPSIAVDRTGAPYVAFGQLTIPVAFNDYFATVVKYNGTKWDTLGLPRFSAGQALYTSIALDSSDIPYVVYQDDGHTEKATVVKFNAGSWVNVGAPGFSTSSVNYTSIAIDANGTNYVAYQGNFGGGACVDKYDGTNWVPVGIHNFSSGRAPSTCMAIDAAGTIYVAYIDQDYGNKASVMKFNGSNWVYVGSRGFSSGKVERLSMTLNKLGLPYVLFEDDTSDYKATVMNYNGRSWQTVGTEGFSANIAYTGAIIVDASGVPYVAYGDGSVVDSNGFAKGRVSKFNGTDWITVGGAGLSDSVGGAGEMSIAFDPTGIPYLVLQDSYQQQGVSVVKFGLSPIIHPATICAGSVATLVDSAGGGTWSSSNTAIATINSTTGEIYGVTTGIDTITYRVSGYSVSAAITVAPLPYAGIITGTASVCAGSTTTLADTTVGSWVSLNTAIASVDTSGVVSGVVSGAVTIVHVVTNSCGSDSASFAVTFVDLPIVPTISGSSSVCIYAADTLTETTIGGIWSASTGYANVDTLGIVHGLMSGMDTITYVVSNACGAAATSYAVTVNPLPVAGTISGADSLCVGASATFSVSVSDGSWSIANGHIALADSFASAISAGSDTLIYKVTTSCGIATATYNVIVNALPVLPVITGADSVCEGATVTLSTSVGGGVWSGGTGVATISGGTVTGVSMGDDVFSYTLANSCGSSVATKTVAVHPLPVAGSISYASSFVCVGAAIGFSDTVVGGTWSASSVGAMVSSSGSITGVAPGADTIFYTVVNSCGTAVALQLLTIGAAPAATPITGVSALNAGANTTLFNTVSGGTWSSSNDAVATVNASTGVVTGVAAGNAVISYSITNSCGSVTDTSAIIVNYGEGISGNVLFGSTVYIGDVKVWLIRYDTATLDLEAVDSIIVYSSGSSAYFHFSGVSTDSFRIKAAIDTAYVPTGYIPTYYIGSYTWGGASVVYHISGASDGGLDISMQYGSVATGSGFVGGSVTTGAGKATSGGVPAEGILMYLVNTTTGTMVRQAYTNSSGDYSFSSLPVGTIYEVYPEDINYASTAATDLTLTSAVTSMNNVDFIMHTNAHTIVPVTTGVSTLPSFVSSVITYPNPANGNLAIQWQESTNEQGTVIITDISGREVYRSSIKMVQGTGKTVVDITGLIAGSYIISVRSANIDYNNKFEIAH